MQEEKIHTFVIFYRRIERFDMLRAKLFVFFYCTVCQSINFVPVKTQSRYRSVIRVYRVVFTMSRVFSEQNKKCGLFEGQNW